MIKLQYKDLKVGDLFRLQPEGKMVQYDLRGHFCKDRRVYRKTNNGDLEIIDCHGNKCEAAGYKVYSYLTMPVWKLSEDEI